MAIARGRGRLSKIDQLPEEALDDVVWALGQLNERRRTQADVLFEFNDRLEVKGIDPISRSAFNRRSTRLAKRAMQLEERRHVYTGIAEKLTPEEVSKSDIVLGEFLKMLIDELLEGDGLNAKNTMELARAYKDTVSTQEKSIDRRKQLTDAKENLSKAIDLVEGEMEKTGTTVNGQDVIRKIREEVYGIFEK